MPTVYLPTEHSEADLALAGRVAERLECSALYVTWSSRGYAEPELETVLRPVAVAVEPPTHSGPFAGAIARLAACIAGFFAAPVAADRARPADAASAAGASHGETVAKP